jgi:hypothetical protein
MAAEWARLCLAQAPTITRRPLIHGESGVSPVAHVSGVRLRRVQTPRNRRIGYGAAVLIVVALVVSGCGSSAPGKRQTYSVAQTRAAFSAFDLRIVAEKPPGANLRPAAGEPLLVTVETTDEVMDQAWSTSSAVWAADGGFAARRANVAVTPTEDAPVSDKQRAQVLAALNALPDSGFPVVVATP